MGIDRYRARHTWGYMDTDLLLVGRVKMDCLQCVHSYILQHNLLSSTALYLCEVDGLGVECENSYIFNYHTASYVPYITKFSCTTAKFVPGG